MSLDPRRTAWMGGVPQRVFASAVVGLGADEVFGYVSDFAKVGVGCCGSGLLRVERCEGGSDGAVGVGAVRQVRGADGCVQKHVLTTLSAAKHVVRWRVVEAEAGACAGAGADGGSEGVLVGATLGLALTPITESNATYIGFSVDLARAPCAGAHPALADVLQAGAQDALRALRMQLQNNHELLRVRFRPYTRPRLLLQSVSDLVVADAADALAANNSVVTELTLAHGSASGASLALLLAALTSPTGVAASLQVFALASLDVATPELVALLEGLAAADPPLVLTTLKLLGSTVGDAAMLDALAPALETLADACPSLVQVEVHVGAPVAATLPAGVTNRVQRNRVRSLDAAGVVATLPALDLVTNALIEPEAAARAARALSAAVNMRSLWIHDVDAPAAVLDAFLGALADMPALTAFRFSRTRQQPLSPPYLRPLLTALSAATQLRVLELGGLDLSGATDDGEADAGADFLLSLVRANTPLEVIVAPQPRPVPDATLVAIASAVAEANTHCVVLDLASASGAHTPPRSPHADGTAFGYPGAALLASALLANRAAAIRTLVRRVATSDPTLTELTSELLVDEHSLVIDGLADALRANTTIETIRHFHASDAAAVAIGEALLDNPRSAVSLVQLDGRLTELACAVFTTLVHARDSLSVSLGPANPYLEHSRSFVHSPL